MSRVGEQGQRRSDESRYHLDDEKQGNEYQRAEHVATIAVERGSVRVIAPSQRWVHASSSLEKDITTLSHGRHRSRPLPGLSQFGSKLAGGNSWHGDFRSSGNAIASALSKIELGHADGEGHRAERVNLYQPTRQVSE